MLEDKIKDHFSEINTYVSRKGITHPQDSLILNFVKKTIKQDSNVLEVGGGSGYMLDLINSETGNNNLYNVEIVPEVYCNQANKNIKLIGGNVTKLPLDSNQYDYVIVKNLLHHLVSNTRSNSKKKRKKSY